MEKTSHLLFKNRKCSNACVHLNEKRLSAVFSVIYRFQRKMKQFCAVCILLILTHDHTCSSLRGKRLKCNLCVSKGLKDPCTPSVQTCLPHITHCGHIVLRPDLLGSAFIRSCISMTSCWSYMDNKDVTVKCCSTDLCN